MARKVNDMAKLPKAPSRKPERLRGIPEAPSRKPPEGFRTPEDRWGTKYMTHKENMQFGNMVISHNEAQQAREEKRKATPVPRGRVSEIKPMPKGRIDNKKKGK